MDFINSFSKLIKIYNDYLFNLTEIDPEYEQLSKNVTEGFYKLEYSEYRPELSAEKEKYGTSDKEYFDMFISGRTYTDIHNLNSYIGGSNPISLLLDGYAGNGKTHLLCDMLKQSVETDEYIFLLFLGNWLKENTLEKSIINELKEFNSIDEFLETLNVYAKSRNQIAIFAIDGINEWEYSKRNQIEVEINLLKEKIAQCSNIKFIVSCRTEYLDDIFSTEFRQDIFKIRHQGFLSNSIEALHQFCDKYAIEPPSAPLLTPELSNPLILKTLCEAFKNQKKFPNSITGISNIFDAYINHLNQEISEDLDIDADDKKVIQVINKIAELMYKNKGKFDIPKAEIKESIKDIEVSSKWSETILQKLEKSGLIVLNKEYSYLSYDRYRDFLIVKLLLEDINESKLVNAKKILKEKIKVFSSSYMYSGFIDFLSIAVPEKWGFELIDSYKNERQDQYFWDNIISSFSRSIPQRDISSISKRTEEILEKIKTYKEKDYKDYFWQTIISCAPIEEHPFNADYLHSQLSELSMQDIDAEWTQFISLNYDNHFDKGYHDVSNYFSINSLLNPLLKLDNSNMPSKSIELITTLLVWFTTSTNRELRNQASQACVNLLLKKEDLLIKLINKFRDVKDIYLQERLYAIAYGVTLFSEDKTKIKEIAKLVYNNIFDKKIAYPNILVRDSVYGILMYAKSIGLDLLLDRTKIEPPYNYPKIKRYPSNNYIQNNYGTYPKEPYKDKTLYSKFSIESSTEPHSDFMRYKVGDYFLGDWVGAPERKQMCNWLCKKSYNLGWSYEKHGKFDYNVRKNLGREEGNIERIGKKYQWIAFHEYLCNLMDNYLYKEKYADEESRQALLNDFNQRRNYDPTFLVSNIEDFSDWRNAFKYWTHPNINNKELFPIADLKKQQEWLNGIQNNVCKGQGLIEVKDEKETFFVLNNFISQRESKYNNLDTYYYRDFGLSLRSFLCKTTEKEKIIKSIKEKFESKINGFQIYRDTQNLNCIHLLEYPWSCAINSEIKNARMLEYDELEIETKNTVYNLDKLYVPSFELIDLLDLTQNKDKTYIWRDTSNRHIFKNTFIENKKTDIPVVYKNRFLELLNKTDYSIIFSVSTEKRLLSKDTHSDAERYPWMYYLTLYGVNKENKLEELYTGSFSS